MFAEKQAKKMKKIVTTFQAIRFAFRKCLLFMHLGWEPVFAMNLNG